MSTILNIATYRFVSLIELDVLREQFIEICMRLEIKGTILLSKEGININLAGAEENIEVLIQYFDQDERFRDLNYKKTLSIKVPFRRLRVRLKKEIITFRKEVNPNKMRGKYLSPQELKTWLEVNKDFILLDTRNAYEAKIGTFSTAKTLPINCFTEFPDAIEKENFPKNKPVVMFCTGGIRCEKASSWMLQAGYQEVYQLEGGILKYFQECGNVQYQGDCFVFDERTAITPKFEETGLTQCPRCKNFVTPQNQKHPDFIPWKQCQYCAEEQKILRKVA